MTERINIPRIAVGAAGSGTGKTTFVCGLLYALGKRGKRPISFKCGPDYIDPMFHSEVLSVPSSNLDTFFCGRDGVRDIIAARCGEGDIAVIEGVMGYYDGLAGISDKASTFDVADATDTPALLMINGRGKSLSMAAEIKGFLDFKENSRIKGIILTRITGSMYSQLKGIIEDSLDVKVMGYMPEMKDCSLESRHLGLVTAGEVKNLKGIIERLGKQAEETVDIDGIISMAEEAPAFESAGILPAAKKKGGSEPVRIAIAMDRAFCFYYRENISLLESLGAEPVFFSPLDDSRLPEATDGLIIGGGYPELYLEELQRNVTMRGDIRRAVCGGMPCLAECGGFMYLHDEIESSDGKAFRMAGVLGGRCFPRGKLVRFGYVTLTAEEDNILCRKGEKLRGHEFHYWDSTENGEAFRAEKPLRNTQWTCMVSRGNLLAGYPHIHFLSLPNAAENFIEACRQRHI